MYDNSLGCLTHDKKIFTKNYIKKVAENYGFYRNYILERHLWAYELLSEFQSITQNTCILKGGACTQSYLPISQQRCTADIDILTSLNNNNIIEVLKIIKNNLYSIGIKSSFQEYVPYRGKNLPMVTYMMDLPFYYNPKKRKNNFLLKFDFLFMDTNKLSVTPVDNCETFGMKLNFSPLCISAPTLISDKLLTFAINSIGLQLFKLDGFYKNIYDLYHLLINFKDENTLKDVSHQINKNIGIELSLKKLPEIHINKILDDILKTLLYFAIVDLSYKESSPPKKLKDFQQLYLTKNIKSQLNKDMWSIMSMHLYLWTKALKKYINTNNCEGMESLKSIEQEYEYYVSLNFKNRNKYENNLKKMIYKKNKNMNLYNINNPLRLIYTNYLC